MRILSFLGKLAEEGTVIAKLVVVKPVNAFDEFFQDASSGRQRLVLRAGFGGELFLERIQLGLQGSVAAANDLRGE